jgi:hypothetical protein
MTFTIIPGTTATENSLITPAFLNAGFTPAVQVTGQVAAADIADGAILGRHLANGLIAGLPAATPTSGSLVLVESSGPTLGNATLQQLGAAIPGVTVVENAFTNAPATPSTNDTDELLLYRGSQPAGERLKRITLIQFALADVVTAGTYRAGRITVDSKGRVTNVDPDGGYWKSAEQNLPGSVTHLSLAHDLGAVPAFVDAFLKCVTAEHGFSVGDVVSYRAFFASVSGYETVAFLLKPSSATVVSVFQQCNNADLRVINPSTGAVATPTPANWRIIVTARL